MMQIDFFFYLLCVDDANHGQLAFLLHSIFLIPLFH